MLTATVGTYVAVGFSLAAAAGILAMAWSFLKTWLRTRRWVKVKARVVSWDWEEKKEGTRTKYVLRSVYEYDVNGQTHRGSGGDDMWLDQEDPQAQKGNVKQPGEEVDAYYDPAHPDQAVLERNSGGCGWTLVVLAAIFFGLAGYCVYEAVPTEPPAPAEAPLKYRER